MEGQINRYPTSLLGSIHHRHSFKMHLYHRLAVLALAVSSVAINPFREWDENAVRISGLSRRENSLLKKAVIPAPTDSPAMIQYNSDRKLFISLEKTERQDTEFRQNLSATCTQADIIVQNLRRAELTKYWRENGRFPGQMFALARDQITQTELWKVVRRMPKGALLHAHLTAMLPFGMLLDAVLSVPEMSFNASRPLVNQQALDEAEISFSYNTATDPEINIFGSDYDCLRPVNVTGVSAHFPEFREKLADGSEIVSSGPDGFKRFVKSKMVIRPLESTHHELGIDQVWQRFQSLFTPADTLFSFEVVVRQFWKNLFKELQADGISWVEIRSGGSADRMTPDPDGKDRDNKADPNFWWRVMEDELNQFKSCVSQNTTHPFNGARVIWSDYRGASEERIRANMESALLRKGNFSDVFSGYDLVGQEDLRTLQSWTPLLLGFQEEARKKNLSMPFFFHAGETVGDGNTTDENLFDAIQLGTRRIGHGFSLYKHPLLVRSVKERNIMVEVCPISNEVLRLATDILHHPLPAMIAYGVPTAISNDDPAMLGQDAAGLSYDFYQVIQAFDNVGFAGLGALAQNSLRWSNFVDQTDQVWEIDIKAGELGTGIKGERLRQWKQQWEGHCRWIVEEYSSTYGQ